MPSCILLLFLSYPLASVWSASIKDTGEPIPGSQAYWRKTGRDALKANRMQQPNVNRAKNIILFIGDGMSISTVTAARIYKHRNKGKRADEKLLTFENVPYVALSKTHTEDFIVPDSAATATAMLSGVKINSLTVGVDSRVKFGNCSSYTTDADVKNIYAYAKEAGLSTGLVTTTSLTHATPGAAYAHSASRYWMSDKDLKKQVSEDDRSKCKDLASQFLTNALDIDVILGGGKEKFVPSAQGGEREDGRNIIDEWIKKQQERGRTARFFSTKSQLNSAGLKYKPDRILGVFAKGNMPYYDERKSGLPAYSEIPTLAEMVSTAVYFLKQNPKGFFLMVEGGRIDHAHHYGFGRRALEEVVGLDAAYEKVKNALNPEESLLITTADHAHTFSIGGYPSRGSNIFGFPDQDTERTGPGRAQDHLPFTILGYANGPGAEVNKSRADLTAVDTSAATFQQQAAVPLRKETHGGDDVGIYSVGPMAHLLNGVQQQNYIHNVMMYAGCLGEYKTETHCAGSRLLSGTVALLSAMFCLFIRR